MSSKLHRAPRSSDLLLALFVISALSLAGLFSVLSWLTYDPTVPSDPGERHAYAPLTVFSAAGLRYPMDEIAAAYTAAYGTPIQLQYGGSNTMLSQLEVGQLADLYIAADDLYIALAAEKGLIKERMPIAQQTPVIVASESHASDIRSVEDLYRKELRYALGDMQATAIGKKTKEALSGSDHWNVLKENATVIKPTVNEVASAVSLGSVDAGIVWDSTAKHYDNLTIIRDPSLDHSIAHAELAVTSNSTHPTSALHFARYISASNKGLPVFAKHGFTAAAGDEWEESPQITFFAGAVNRRAVEDAVEAFERREGVRVNTVYNGCGILTAQMRSLHSNHSTDFPDSFMACDVYYMDAVSDLFMRPVNISDTEIVLVVKQGNPKAIHTLQDLIRPGIRVAVGQPRQCTIGILSQRLLEAAGVSTQLDASGNIVTQTTSSALLVPNIVTESADVALAYRVDAESESGNVDVIAIDSPLAKAIQPFGISRQSTAKQLNARLFDTISSAKKNFLENGFGWRLVEGERPEISAPQSTGNVLPAHESPKAQ